MKFSIRQHIQIENTREKLDKDEESEENPEREKSDGENFIAEKEKTEPVSEDESEIEEESEEEQITPENEVELDNKDYQEIKYSPTEDEQSEDEKEVMNMFDQSDPIEVSKYNINENEVDSNFRKNEEKSLDEPENELRPGNVRNNEPLDKMLNLEIETRNVRLGREEGD